MDVVAYDTETPTVLFAAEDVDRATATAWTGESVDIRRVASVAEATEVVEAGVASAADPHPEERVDCVVTAASLADGTGIELARAVRERDDELPVIYVPATGSVADAKAATAVGATVYLPRERAADGELRERIADVVERYDRRRQLRREREMLAALLETAPLPLFAKDDEARHVAVSSYVARGIERSPLGATDQELYGEKEGRSLEGYQDDRSVIETGDPILEKEHRGTTQDGQEEWYRTTKHPWRRTDGEIQGLVGVAREVTAMKERERDLERQRWRLRQFAEFTSTELREPVITGLDALDRARRPDGTLAPDSDPALEEVADALDRMQSLIETLLTMTGQRTEAPELSWVALEDAVAQAWASIEGATATIEHGLDDAVEVEADPDQLHRLLDHLFRHALERGSAVGSSETPDATGVGSRDGEGVEEIRVGLTDQGFYVEDDGPALETADDAEAFAYRGLGHRIAIARDVAEAHGWSLEIGPADDGGARLAVEDCLLRPSALARATTGPAIDLDHGVDVGDAEPPGEATRAGDGWAVHGGGRNVWQDVCQFHGVWATVEGDLRVQARVADLDPVHERCKAGVVVFDPEDGPLSYVGLTGTAETETLDRSVAGEPIRSTIAPDWEGPGLYYRIDLLGDRTVQSVSPDGEDWTVVDQQRFDGSRVVAAGLAVCSHSTERLAEATFEDVRVWPLEVTE